MRIAVVGLGAVGGLIAARMAAAGHAVSALARGETLARSASAASLVDSAGKRSMARIVVEADARALGAQELVVIALKAPALAAPRRRSPRCSARDGRAAGDERRALVVPARGRRRPSRR